VPDVLFHFLGWTGTEANKWPIAPVPDKCGGIDGIHGRGNGYAPTKDAPMPRCFSTNDHMT
jgi:hypothetical protein